MKTFFRHSIRLLVAVLVFMLAPSTMIAADDWSYPTGTPSSPFGGGNGTKDNPFIISTAQHLANLAYMVSSKGKDYEGKYFLQTADIVLNDNVLDGAPKKEANGRIHYNQNTEYFDNLKRWQPIGMYGTVYDDDFEGIYDGGGHSISGIYCRKPIETSDKAYRYIGLFGTCDDALIKNLTIKDCYFSICAPTDDAHTVSLGTLIGLSTNTIVNNCHAENCMITSDGDIMAINWSIGGLIGEVEGTFTAKDCSYDGMVDAYMKEYTNGSAILFYVGGIVGSKGINDWFNKSFYMEGCSTSGKLWCNDADFVPFMVGGRAFLGGMVGGFEKAATDSEKPHILRCTNRMDIRAFGDGALILPNHPDIRLSGISCGDNTVCSECANFGSMNFAANNDPELGENIVRISGISTGGTADHCFNYGNIDMNNIAQNLRNMHVGQWIAEEGKASDCFACNSIRYNTSPRDGSVPRIYYGAASEGKVETTNAKCYATVNDEVKKVNMDNDDNTYFTSQSTVEKLNEAAGATKYGLIKEDGFLFDGHLSLTSLGAMAYVLHGHGSEADPYIINNVSDLRSLVYMITNDRDFTGNIFKLNANIDMTDEPEMDYIGDEDNPFSGVFDGNGHYIRGMKSKKGAMFRTVTGTVKNLALDDFKSTDGNVFGGIALSVRNGGTIDNCYVTGDADLKPKQFTSPYFGGICYRIESGGTVSNCYYIGNVRFSKPEQDVEAVISAPRVGGIAATADGTIANCYAVFNFYNDLSTSTTTAKVNGIIGESYQGSPTLTNNFYHITVTDKEQTTEIQQYSGTTAANGGYISAADLGSAWLEGVRRPVLKSAYHYVCQDNKGNDVGLDPAGYTPTNNSILTITPTAEQKEDTQLWQLPNVAVYSDDLDAEILANFSIIDGAGNNYSLRYKPTKEGVSVKGLVTYPWKVERNYVNWHSFCLPGAVDKSNLPEGCKLYVGGTLQKGTGTDRIMNIVEVESVPAGVPFLVRYYNQTDADTVYITMTGDLKMQPQKADDASSLVGTFGHVEDSYIHYIVNEDEATDGNTKIYMQQSASVDGFRAYVASDNIGSIELTEYLLLDEQSNNTDEVVAANNDKTLNIKLRRSIRTGGWNTVCLPFGVNSAEITDALGANTRMEQLESVDYDAATGSVVMTFGAVQAIEAGKPYLVYPEKAASIFDFAQHAIAGTTTPALFDVTLGDGTSASISMVGSYGKAYLASTDDEDQYFIQQDKFYRATQANPVVMSGFRCWFKVTYTNATGGTTGQVLKSARLMHSDGTVTNIKLVDTGLGTGSTHIYDIQGIQHSEMQRGLNIVGGKKIVKK